MNEPSSHQNPQHVFIIDSEELLPTKATEFRCRSVDHIEAGEFLKSHVMWFWHFAGSDFNQRRTLEEIAATAGLRDETGYRLEDRALKSRTVLSDTHVLCFLLVRHDGGLEILTPK